MSRNGANRCWTGKGTSAEVSLTVAAAAGPSLPLSPRASERGHRRPPGHGAGMSRETAAPGAARGDREAGSPRRGQRQLRAAAVKGFL